MVGVADEGVAVAHSGAVTHSGFVEGPPPSFSVLCSAYRCEAYLAATIDSVIAQTDGTGS